MKTNQEIFAPRMKARLANYLMAPGNIILVFVLLAFCLIGGSFADYALSSVIYDASNVYGQFIGAFGMLPFSAAFSVAGVLFFCACDKNKIAPSVAYIIFGIALNVAGWLFMQNEFCSNLALFQRQGQEVALVSAGPVFFACLGALPIAILDLWIIRTCEGVSKKRIVRFAWFICFVLAVQDLVINQVIKELWCRPRMRMIETGVGPTFQPWWNIGYPDKAFYVAQGVKAEEFRSFPSGHTSNAACIFLICALPALVPSLKRYRSFYFWISVAVVACVMVGRIIAGAHFLSDVTAGCTVTFTTVVVGLYLFFRNKVPQES